METIYDLSKITRSLKTDEKVIAFTKFSIDHDSQPGKEGVLKISSYSRPDWSGYLTLTFIMETEGDPQVLEDLARHFSGINENTLRPHFKEEFETIFRCPIDAQSKSPAWYFEEINIYFKALKGRERRIIEQHLIPALQKMLPFHFDPVEWWDQQSHKPVAIVSATRKSKPETGSLKSELLKTDEKVIAFTGFSIDHDNQAGKEGVLKISSYSRPDWSGYLTLTFIMETEGDPRIHEDLAHHFSTINENTLRPHFKEEFETIFRCPMDAQSKSPAWYFEEINIYFKALKGRERRIIDQHLIPSLEKMLPFHFDPVEWWDQQPRKSEVAQSSVAKNTIEARSLKAALMKWFRSF
ncbi:MAG: hypothetical protein HY881_12955 [Deltaproteobacteria bacterium]|nr:hypothetical protein [Deltaproteobacteria bacterium]